MRRNGREMAAPPTLYLYSMARLGEVEVLYSGHLSSHGFDSQKRRPHSGQVSVITRSQIVNHRQMVE